MPSQQKDYILRLIDQLRHFVTEIVRLRQAGRTDEALQGVLRAQERLFVQSPDRFLALTPEEQFATLTRGETPDNARAKTLIQADLLAETALIYEAREQPPLALGARHFAVQLLEMTATHFPDSPENDIGDRIARLRSLLEVE